MENTGQNLGNHVRWDPPYHFVMTPILMLNVLWTAYKLWGNPGLDGVVALVVAIALAMLGLYARVNALRAQDRVIRLEEHLRYQRVLPAELAKQAIASLSVAQIIGLRFAADGELADLVSKTLSGTLTAQADIKKAIRNWRGDYVRV